MSRTASSFVRNRQLRRRQPADRLDPEPGAAPTSCVTESGVTFIGPLPSAASPSPDSGLSERVVSPTPNWLGPLSRRATLGFLFQQQCPGLSPGPSMDSSNGPNCSTEVVRPVRRPTPSEDTSVYY